MDRKAIGPLRKNRYTDRESARFAQIIPRFSSSLLTALASVTAICSVTYDPQSDIIARLHVKSVEVSLLESEARTAAHAVAISPRLINPQTATFKRIAIWVFQRIITGREVQTRSEKMENAAWSQMISL